MTLFLVFALVAISVGLCWLIVTLKISFPILFDVGMALVAFGALVSADSLLTGDGVNRRGLILIVAGVVAMLLSCLRESKKQAKRQRQGEPLMVNVQDWKHIRGGKR